MTNDQKLYEININATGENLILTKEFPSKYVKSDVFALGSYKRSVVTLIGGENTVFQGGKMFFSSKFSDDTTCIWQSQNTPLAFESGKIEEDASESGKNTFFSRIADYFKGTKSREENFPSSSFAITKNGGKFHFVGALCEDNFAVSFRFDRANSLIVAKAENTEKEISTDTVVFDILEVEGSEEFVFNTYFEMTKRLHQREPKTSYALSVFSLDASDASQVIATNHLSEEEYALAIMQSGDIFDFATLEETAKTFIANMCEHAKENIIPILQASPFLCEKESLEYQLLSDSLALSKNKKPQTITVGEKKLYILDVFSPAVIGYYQQNIGKLFEKGFCGVCFDHLLEIAKKPKHGKTMGETAQQISRVLEKIASGKLIIAQNCYLGATYPVADFFLAKDIDFQNVFQTAKPYKTYSNMLPPTIDATLLETNEKLFQLQLCASLIAFGKYNFANPTKEALQYAKEFASLSELPVMETYIIDEGIMGLILGVEKAPIACFLNFTEENYLFESTLLPAWSIKFED